MVGVGSSGVSSIVGKRLAWKDEVPFFGSFFSVLYFLMYNIGTRVPD